MNPTIIPDTAPRGMPLPPRPAWRPEQDVTDSCHALAAKLDGHDPDFDAIASIAATRLLMAGAELDVIARRRARVRTVLVPRPAERRRGALVRLGVRR